MKKKSFEIGGVEVAPGTRARVEIPTPPLFIQTAISIVAVVAHGARPGPRLLVSAGVHGDEVNGIIIVSRTIAAVDPARLRGTLVAVPVVNPYGLIDQSRYLPDRRDLNRSFPGSARGSLASRLAHVFMNEVVRLATHQIDLHTAAIHNRNWPQIRGNLDDAETLRCARAFGAPIMIHAEERDGSLREAASRRGVTSLLYEAGAALRLDDDALEVGTAGVLRVMRALGMVDAAPRAPAARPLVSRSSSWVRAPRSGLFQLGVRPGERVRAGASLGNIVFRIHRDFFAETEMEVPAPFGGAVVGVCENPLVHQGDALVHIARLGEPAARPARVSRR